MTHDTAPSHRKNYIDVERPYLIGRDSGAVEVWHVDTDADGQPLTDTNGLVAVYGQHEEEIDGETVTPAKLVDPRALQDDVQAYLADKLASGQVYSHETQDDTMDDHAFGRAALYSLEVAEPTDEAELAPDEELDQYFAQAKARLKNAAIDAGQIRMSLDATAADLRQNYVDTDLIADHAARLLQQIDQLVAGLEAELRTASAQTPSEKVESLSQKIIEARNSLRHLVDDRQEMHSLRRTMTEHDQMLALSLKGFAERGDFDEDSLQIARCISILQDASDL